MQQTIARYAQIALVIISLRALAGAVLAEGSSPVLVRNSPVLIQQPIDELRLVVLAGNTAPEAASASDLGRVEDNFRLQHILLQLKRSPEQERSLTSLIDDLHNPDSAHFHKWLTAPEFGSRFGLADHDVDSITDWLESHCLHVNAVYPSRMLIDFSGAAGQIREAFHTEIHRLSVAGRQHIANVSDPSIPAALAPAVAGIVSLHDFMPQSLSGPNAKGSHAGYTSLSGGSAVYNVSPGDLATIYNLNPVFQAGFTGQNTTIAIVEVMDLYNPNDWETFRDVFGLSTYTSGSLTTIHPTSKNTKNCTAPGYIGFDAEAIVDAEWASAAAPGATIEVASCANTTSTFGAFIAVENLVNGVTVPDIISISYGRCETYNGAAANAAYKAAYQQAVTEGTSVFVAGGDSGAACNWGQTDGVVVSGLASTPYNVAVGGTDFGDTYAGANSAYWTSGNTSVFASAKSYIPEIPWNDTCGSVLLAHKYGYPSTYGSAGFCNNTANPNFLSTMAGGGGPSGCATFDKQKCAGWPKPAWQTGVVGLTNDGVRDLPDVSLFSGKSIWQHTYVYCDSAAAPCTANPATWSLEGGTSFGAPIMAGIQALINQKMGQRQGNPNYVYYKLAAKEYGATGSTSCDSSRGNQIAAACIFHDVTAGDTDVPCTGAQNCYVPWGRIGVLSLSSTAYKPAYAARIGWDFATGIGTVNAYNLVNSWATVSLPAAGSQAEAIAAGK